LALLMNIAQSAVLAWLFGCLVMQSDLVYEVNVPCLLCYRPAVQQEQMMVYRDVE